MPVSSSVGFFTSFRMTENKKKYVILSASEISHDQSEKYIPYGNPPSREFASLAMTTNFKVLPNASFAGIGEERKASGKFVGKKFFFKPDAPVSERRRFVYTILVTERAKIGKRRYHELRFYRI